MNIKPKMNVQFLLISLFILLYLLLILVPYANRNDLFSEYLTPQGRSKWIYIILSYPVMIGYVVYAALNIRKITFLRSVNYPLLIINVYLGFFMCLISEGGTILWLMVITIFVPIITIPLSIIFGAIKDVQYLKRNKQIS